MYLPQKQINGLSGSRGVQHNMSLYTYRPYDDDWSSLNFHMISYIIKKKKEKEKGFLNEKGNCRFTDNYDADIATV